MFITCLVGIFLIAIVDLLPKRIEKPYNVLVVSSGMPFLVSSDMQIDSVTESHVDHICT